MGGAVYTALASTMVTARCGAAFLSARAQVAPANPPPMTITCGPAPWESRGEGNIAAETPAAAAVFKNWRRFVRVPVISDSAWTANPSDSDQTETDGAPTGQIVASVKIKSGGARRRPDVSHQDKTVVPEREGSIPLAGGRRDGVKHRWRCNTDRRLAHTAPEPARRHDDGLDLRHLLDAHHIVGVKILLLDPTILDGAAPEEQPGQAIHKRTRDLSLNLSRIH